jgi:hypothetical protein
MLYKFLNGIRLLFVRILKNVEFAPPEYTSNDFGWTRGTPIDRFYLQQFFKDNRSFIKGDSLEFGEDTYTKLYGLGVTQSGIFTSDLDEKQKEGMIAGDISKSETLPSDKYDCIICTNVLNFIYDIHASVEGLYLMLKPGGICLVSIAGYSSHVSRYDMNRWGDYWRLSDKAAVRMFEEAGFIIDEVKTFGNAYAAVAQMYGYCAEDVDVSRLTTIHPDHQMLITMRIRKYSL